MDKNKSIDGLTPRRAKAAANLSKPAPETTTKPTAKSPSKTTSKPATITTSPKATNSTKTSKTTNIPKTSKTASKSLRATNPKTSRPLKSSKSTTKPQKPVNQSTHINDISTPAPQPTHKTPAEINADFLTPVQVFDFDADNNTLTATGTTPPTSNSKDNANPTSSLSLDTDNITTSPSEFASEPSNNPLTSTDPTESATPLTAKHKKPKKAKKPVSKKRKIITSIILVIVLLLIAGITWLVLWGNDIIAKITGGQGNILDLITFVEPTYERLKTDENGRTNILAFGTSGYNMEGDEGNGTHDGAQLTDSIMVISFNQDTGDIAMLSLPRDLKASPTCTATGKINEVYWCNNMDGTTEQAGAEALMTEVGDILNIDFQYYAHLNWGSLVQIVDQLGGITVTLDENIEDYYFTGVVFEAGKPYTISGIEAVALARARHGTTGGDFSRGASQQKILIGIKDKIQEKELSLTDLIGFANTLGDNLRTNFNVEELKSIAHLASEFNFDTMRQISLIEPEMLMTTGTINGISYVLPAGGSGYYTRIQNYVAKMLSNNPSVYEDATILILNGTETPGLAASEQKSLEDEGYANISIDDAPEGTYEDEYALYITTDEKPATKKSLEAKYSLEAKPSTDLPADIPTDYDFIIIIGGSTSAEE